MKNMDFRRASIAVLTRCQAAAVGLVLFVSTLLFLVSAGACERPIVDGPSPVLGESESPLLVLVRLPERIAQLANPRQSSSALLPAVDFAARWRLAADCQLAAFSLGQVLALSCPFMRHELSGVYLG